MTSVQVNFAGVPSRPVADPDTAIDFLRLVAADGWWALCAYQDGQIEARTFEALAAPFAKKWIRDNNAARKNIYFMVAQPRALLDKKAVKEDCESSSFAWVDVDPGAGEFIAERRRILDKLRNFKPAPTGIIDSGGGYQGYWKLATAAPLDTPEARGEFERRTKRLAAQLGGDNCWNCDRIMRVPGTINWPDAKKRAKGRLRALATVVEWHKGCVYDLSDLPIDTAATARAVDIDFDDIPSVESIKDILALKGPRHTRLRRLIETGDDPERNYKSRSEAHFAAITGLIRVSVSDPMIAAIITSKKFGISDGVLDKRDWKKYVKGEIERAHAKIAAPTDEEARLLAQMNERHAVIGNVGGKTVVIDFGYGVDDSRRAPVSLQLFQAVVHRYLNVAVNDDTLGSWWLHHPQRQQYERMEFLPGKETRPEVYNLWRGWAVEPKPGDCRLFLAHIRDNICGGDAECYEYLLNWMALAVQRPWEQGKVAVVLRGAEGTGKSFFVRTFGSLFGRHFLTVSDARHLTGNFNAHLEDCTLLFADEAMWAGDRQGEGALKRMITEPDLTIEPKGIGAYSASNRLHIMMASNAGWVVPAGTEARRFFVLDVGRARMRDTAYFKKIAAQMKNGGAGALLHMLQARDLGGFDVTKFPHTAALTDQILHTLKQRPAEYAVYELLSSGARYPQREEWLKPDGSVFIVSKLLCDAAHDKRLNESALGRVLDQLAIKGTSNRERWGRNKHRGRWLPRLREARRRFEQRILGGKPVAWGEIDEWLGT